MTYKPKADHPWRQYRNRPRKLPLDGEEEKALRPLKDFLSDIVTFWNTFQIPSDDPTISNRIKNLQDSRIAIWLADFLKKYYSGQDSAHHESYPN